MKKKNIIAIIVIAVLVAVIIVKLVGNKQELVKHSQIEDRSNIPTSVNVATASLKIMDQDIIRPAMVMPNESATIAPSLPGELVRLSIELGDKVRKGEVIGKIDTKVNNVQVESLELAVAKMETDFERNKSLYEGNALSESQFLDSKFAYQTQKLKLKQLKQQIADSYIKSPLNGIITVKNHVAGEFIGAGTPVASVVDINSLKINVFVNESEVRYIRINQEVKITSDVYADTNFLGIVTYISPNADQNFNYTIEVQIKNKAKDYVLRPGNYVKVYFHPETKKEALQIPKKALIAGIKNAYVYVAKEQRAQRRKITVGRENGSYIEVLSGLKAGEKVVVDGQINIVDGSLIESKNTK